MKIIIFLIIIFLPIWAFPQNELSLKYAKLAEAAYDKEKYEDAILNSTKSIEALPNNAPSQAKSIIYRERARAYFQLNKINEGIADCIFAIELDSHNWNAIYLRMFAYAAIEKYDLAIKDATLLLPLIPNNNLKLVYIFRTYCYEKTQQYNLSLIDYNKLIEIDPSSTYYSSRGEIYEKLGQTQNAVSDYSKAIDLDSKNESAYLKRGIIFLNTKDYIPALSDFDNCIKINGENKEECEEKKQEISNYYLIANESDIINNNPNNIDAYYRRARIKELVSDYDGAILDLTKAIELNPAFAVAYLYRAQYYYFYFSNFKNALQDINMAIKLNPTFWNNYPLRVSINQQLKTPNQELIDDYSKAIEFYKTQNDTLGMLYAKRAELFFDIQKYPEAKNDFEFALQLDKKSKALYERKLNECNSHLNPNNSESFKIRGEQNLINENYEEAIADYSKAIDLDPKDATAYSGRGIAKYRLQDYQGSISDYTKAIELDPKYATAYTNRGIAKYAMQDYQGVISDYLKVIELDPKNVTAYYNLGLCYFAQKNYDAAIEISEKALLFNDEINPALLDNLGYYYMEKGSYDKAIEKFKDCLKIENNRVLVDASLGTSLAYYYKNEKQNAKKYLDQAKQIKPVLNNGMEGLLEIEKEGYWYSDKKKETLKIMFEELK